MCRCAPAAGALEAGGGEFEGPVGTGGSGHPQLANCFWFVQVEGSAVSSAASSAATSAGSSAAPSVGAPRTPGATPPGTRSNSIDVGGNKEARLRRSSTELPLHLFSSKPLPAVLEGLQMGPMIGSGSFGRGECLFASQLSKRPFSKCNLIVLRCCQVCLCDRQMVQRAP